MRRQWSSASYWKWWWRNEVSQDAKIVAAVVAIGLLGLGGYVAANGLESSVGGAEADANEVELVTMTVRKLVTVEKPGRVVTAPARVVSKRVGGGVVTNRVSDVRVRSVTEPGETRVVTERDVVPVVRRERVTVDGGVRTVVRDVPAAPETRTVERVVTEERVVTVVGTRTVTETVAVTVTTPPVTMTAGPITLTVTLPLPPRP